MEAALLSGGRGCEVAAKYWLVKWIIGHRDVTNITRGCMVYFLLSVGEKLC